MKRLSYIVMDAPAEVEAGVGFPTILSTLRDAGYEGIELNIAKPLGFDVDNLAKNLAAHDMALPSFLTGAAYGDGLCLSSPDIDVRKRTIERLVSYVDVAARFNSILVVGLLQGFRTDEPDPKIANLRISDCLREVAGPAGAAGVDIVMEPVNHLQVGFNNSVAEILALIAQIGSPFVRPMVDTIHMNIEDRSLTQPIRDLGPQLRHVHLCESNGGSFGTGNIDFAPVLQALDDIDYAHFASVKVYRGKSLKENAQQAVAHLNRATMS